MATHPDIEAEMVSRFDYIRDAYLGLLAALLRDPEGVDAAIGPLITTVEEFSYLIGGPDFVYHRGKAEALLGEVVSADEIAAALRHRRATPPWLAQDQQ